MLKYTTVSGDTFDSIAKKLYGDELLCQKLMKANQPLLGYVVFPAQVEIEVPTVEAANRNYDKLPPWRKHE